MKCELCEKLNDETDCEIKGCWTSLVFRKETERKMYNISPYKILAYGEGVASAEINYCPFCRQKIV